MNKKHNIDVKNKLNYKNIDFKFLIRMLLLSLGLRIIVEQIIYLIPITETEVLVPINISQLIIEFIAICLFAPICEEIIFRFGMYEYIGKKSKFNLFNMILTSILFALIHFYGIDGFIIVGIISFLWNYTYFKTNNLLYPIILHFIHNVYALVSNYILNNSIYIILGLLCFIGYLFLLLKRSNKDATEY